MPLHDYKCSYCGKTNEQLISGYNPPLYIPCSCGNKAVKLLTGSRCFRFTYGPFNFKYKSLKEGENELKKMRSNMDDYKLSKI